MDAKSRFMAKIEVLDNGCWKWIGAIGSGSPTHRYGRFGLNGQSINAHRAAWILFRQEDPIGFYVCHKCDFTLCVNPGHLFLGTNEDNLHDMAVKGRARNQNVDKMTCKHGHPLTAENLYLKNGRRHCRTCRAAYPKPSSESHAAYVREYRRRKREQAA